jgi:hypothetical protein
MINVDDLLTGSPPALIAEDFVTFCGIDVT